jgi:tRNA A37 methylthiotransferase MiaB
LKNIKKKVHIHNATECPRRTLDCCNIHDFLEKNDYDVVQDPRQADDILLVTCAAWDIPEKLAVESLKRLKTYNKNLIVMGCLSEINKDLLERHFNGISISPKKMHLLNERFPHDIPFEKFDKSNDPARYFSSVYEMEKSFTRITDPRNALKHVKRYVNSSVFLGPVKTFRMAWDLLAHRRVYSLKVAKGCIWNCTYCAVKQAVGDLRSRPLEDCIEEAKEAILQEGYQRLRIIADDAGSYGVDIGESLVELLDRLTCINKFFTLWLGETNPFWIIKYFDPLNQILKKKKIVSLLVPVQSGSQRILSLMNRKYDIKTVMGLIKELKRKHRYLHLNTHIIVGFPTETPDDIEANISYIHKIPIDIGNVTMCSERPGTRSAQMEGRLSFEEKEKSLTIHAEKLKKLGYQIEFREGTTSAFFFTR